MLTLVRSFTANRKGATAIEYSLIATGIAGAIITIVFTLGTSVTQMWTTVLDGFR
ncbi:MAG TPA: Flp family type IVb pilin [Pseudolabrys sp.]|nr:Flp family type IVb pilin [Pseudolabrys sp.]